MLNAKQKEIEKAYRILGLSKKKVKKLSKKEFDKFCETKLDIAQMTGDVAYANDVADAYMTLSLLRKKRGSKSIGLITLGMVAALGIHGCHLVRKTTNKVEDLRINLGSSVSYDNNQTKEKDEYTYRPIENTYPEVSYDDSDFTVYRQIAFDQAKESIEDVATNFGVDVVDIEQANTPENIQNGTLFIPYYVNRDTLAVISVPVLEGETLRQFTTRTETELSTLQALNSSAFQEDGKCSAKALWVPDYNALENASQKNASQMVYIKEGNY